MAASNYILLFITLMLLFPTLLPTTVSATRITSSNKGAAAVNRNTAVVHNVAPHGHGSHGIAFGVLRKGRITPSGPSHRGNALPNYRRVESLS
ncbi:hypothetical protein V6N13_015572 [Hibiscus sabdariffa]|uniref:Transmembrane protein n=1 Tax=Hibiscus sabdariffa TaxID=183260 RepID=A0ABR1ZCF1_9ROSI